jgi:hypothetical protein
LDCVQCARRGHGQRLLEEEGPTGRRGCPLLRAVLQERQLQVAAAHAASQQLRCAAEGTGAVAGAAPVAYGAVRGQSPRGGITALFVCCLKK